MKVFLTHFQTGEKKSNFILHYLHRDQNIFFQHLRASDKLAACILFFYNGQFNRERQFPFRVLRGER